MANGTPNEITDQVLNKSLEDIGVIESPVTKEVTTPKNTNENITDFADTNIEPLPQDLPKFPQIEYPEVFPEEKEEVTPPVVEEKKPSLYKYGKVEDVSDSRTPEEIEFQKEEAREESVARTLRDIRHNLKLEPIFNKESGDLLEWGFHLYGPDDSEIPIDSYYFPADELTNDEVNSVFRLTEKRIKDLDLESLASMEGRPVTLTRLLAENMIRIGADIPKTTLTVAGLLGAPVMTGTALAANIITPKEVFGFSTGWLGDFPTIEEFLKGVENTELGFYSTPVAQYFREYFPNTIMGRNASAVSADGGAYIDPLKINEMAKLFDDRRDLPLALIAANIALESLMPTGAYVASLRYLNRGLNDQILEEANTIINKYKKDGVKYDARSLANQLKINIKKIGDEETKKRVLNVSSLGRRFARDQLYNFRYNTAAAVTDIAGGELLYISSALALDRMTDWDVGGGYNAAGSLISSISGTHVLNGLIRGASATAQKGVALSSVFFGDEKTGAIIDFLRGERNLDGIGLSRKEKTNAIQFQKNFSSLGAESQQRIIDYMERGVEVTARLRDMGVRNPEQGFGTLFNLNTLRAIEPEMLMTGLSKVKKKGILGQVSLEDFYQMKKQYTEDLQKHYEDLITMKNDNLKNPNRAEFLTEDVNEYIDSVQSMIEKLGNEKKDSINAVSDALTVDLSNINTLIDETVGNNRVKEKLQKYVAGLKLLDADEQAAKATTMLKNLHKIEHRKLITLAKTTENSEMASGYTSKAIASLLINRIDNVRDSKNTAYANAGKGGTEQIVDGTNIYKRVREEFEVISQSQIFKGKKGEDSKIANEIDDIFSEPATAYIKNIEKTNNIKSGEFIPTFRSSLSDAGLADDEINKITQSPAKLLAYMIDNKVTIQGMDIPTFKLSAQDIDNVRIGINNRIAALGEDPKNAKAFEKYNLIDVKNALDNGIQDLKNSGLLDDALYEAARKENIVYNDIMSTKLYSQTYGTRGRYNKNMFGGYNFEVPVEKWASSIFTGDVKDARKIYDEITLTFSEGSTEYNAIIDSLNMHALNYVQESTSKGVSVDKLQDFGRTIELPNNIKIEVPPEGVQFNNAQTDRAIHMLGALEKASGGKFNFEKAYDFNSKFTNAVRKNQDIAKVVKVSKTSKDKASVRFADKMNDAYEAVINTNKTNKQLLENYLDTDTSKILEHVSNGKLKKVKAELIKNGMKPEKTEEVLYALWVDTFFKKYTVTTTDLMTKSLKKTYDAFDSGKKFVPIQALDANEFIKYLDRNETVIGDIFPELVKKRSAIGKGGEKIELSALDDLRYIAEATAMDIAATSGGRSIRGVEDPTKGLARLTVGSYVSRLYAVASGRTSLRYVAAEAMIVQMKRDEVATMAALMMNPEAAGKVADLIKSGKPLSLTLESAEASWLPQLVGEIDVIRESLFGEEGYRTEGSAVPKIKGLGRKLLDFIGSIEQDIYVSEAEALETNLKIEEDALRKNLETEKKAYADALNAEQSTYLLDNMQNEIAR